MKPSLKSLITTASLAISLIGTAAWAAPDPQFDDYDLVMFFRNPNGITGQTKVVAYSLGSCTGVFRRAATPGDPTYGTTIYLGNLNTELTTAYGTDWTSLSANSTIYGGAVGQVGEWDLAATSITDGDYARTSYFTRRRTAPGSAGSPNSTNFTLPAGTSGQQNIASNIQGANNALLAPNPNPRVMSNTVTIFDEQNPINSFGTPGTAFTAINGGVIGRLLPFPTFTLGSVTDIVFALDLYRGTPVANQPGSWEALNSIPGVVNRKGYFLGTLTLSGNGDINFVAIPEPSSLALMGLGLGIMTFASRRRRVVRNS